MGSAVVGRFCLTPYIPEKSTQESNHAEICLKVHSPRQMQVQMHALHALMEMN
ncbi:uncharacterized protein METZ01_LOCUS179037, partial [marine metagenome]